MHAEELLIATEIVPGWKLAVLTEIPSTNPVAGRLPAWHAVRADIQTAGHGRTGRHWVSDAGGLWLSAVLPCPGSRARWSILPLAAGWAIIAALTELGVPDLRLRWPNDIMTGSRKLAGLLVERFTDDTAVVGIGLNVFNSPESADPSLAGATARLADLTSSQCSLAELTRLILRSVSRAHGLILNDEFPVIVNALNLHWSEPRRVEITLTSPPRTFSGHFHGIDQAGRIIISTDRHGRCAYEAAQVTLLRELTA